MKEAMAASEITVINQASSLKETHPAPQSDPANAAMTNITSSSLTEEVRILDKSEYKQAAACLADAFADDEVSRYFIDTSDRADWSEEQKWAMHVHILECVVYAHCLAGLATTVGPDYACVSLWLPPGCTLDGFLTRWRSGLSLLPWKLSAEGRYRLTQEFFPLLHDTKEELLGARDKDSYYLVYVGTKKAARGKGYARKIIEAQTKIADKEGRVVYLESSNAVNVAIYRKMGFEIAKKICLTRGEKDIELDVMVRGPKVLGAELGE